MIKFVSLLLLFSSLCFANTFWSIREISMKSNDPKNKIYQYIHNSYKPKVVKKIQIPNGVYIIYSKVVNHWVYTLTNEKGTLKEPLEILTPGTVLNGKSIGALNKSNYELKRNGDWTLTNNKRQQIRFWILSKTPKFDAYFSY